MSRLSRTHLEHRSLPVTILHPERPKLYAILDFLSALGLTFCPTIGTFSRQAALPFSFLHSRVRTEIGNQNSRTFPGLFKDYLHFFQESFFIDGNSPNTAYMQDFCPIQDCKRISLSGSLFLPDFISAYCLCTLLSFLPFPISAL